MIAVDGPRDIYLASRELRSRPQVAHTHQDLLNALYIGSGNLGTEPFYDAMWSALSEHIHKLEGQCS
jgi:hypothetical protein